MNCPECSGNNIKTKDVRSFRDPIKNFYYVERRRVCLECEHPFKTIEMDLKDYAKLTSGESDEAEYEQAS
jgi:transcriptional regulator NrdR family protein